MENKIYCKNCGYFRDCKWGINYRCVSPTNYKKIPSYSTWYSIQRERTELKLKPSSKNDKNDCKDSIKRKWWQYVI